MTFPGAQLVAALAAAVGRPLAHRDLAPDVLAERLHAAGVPPATIGISPSYPVTSALAA